MEGLREEIKTFKRLVAERFARVEYELCEIDVEKWQTKEVQNNVLGSACEMLGWAIREDNEFRVGKALDKIHEALKMGARPDSLGEMELERQLEDVPKGHSIIIAAVREQLARSRNGEVHG